MKVTRKLEWDSAHRVMRHESKCATLHGHRYVAEVTCESQDLDEVGRVVDFGAVKAKVGSWIDSKWDHTTLVNARDDDLLAFCHADAQGGFRKEPFVFEGEPTAENIAKQLFQVARGMLNGDGLRVVNVRIFETPNCWAEYSAGDWMTDSAKRVPPMLPCDCDLRNRQWDPNTGRCRFCGRRYEDPRDL